MDKRFRVLDARHSGFAIRIGLSVDSSKKTTFPNLNIISKLLGPF